MTDPFEINENSEKSYYQGKINFLIRLYYYLNEGLNQINNWKYIAAGVIALAVFFKITNWLVISLIVLAVVPISVLIGYLWVMRARKSTEYFSLKYTSPWGKYQIELQERQMALLESISKQLEKLNGKVSDIQNGRYIQSSIHRATGMGDVVIP